MQQELLHWCIGELLAIQQQVYTYALRRIYTREHACLIEHESRLFDQLQEQQNEEAAALSTLNCASLGSATVVQHAFKRCVFSNHVVFPVGYVYLYRSIYRTTCSSWNQLPILLFRCELAFCVSVWWNCCHVTLLHEWFCTSSSPHGRVLTADHVIRDMRTAGVLSLPSTAASKKTFSAHTSHPWRQTSDFPFFNYITQTIHKQAHLICGLNITMMVTDYQLQQTKPS